MKKIIECGNCDFVGTLTFEPDDFSNSDIAFCPVCSFDISSREEDEEVDE